MYILKTHTSFDSAHFLKDYQGKCRNIHGHRWTVEVQVGAEKLLEDQQNRGMVVDFGKLKEDLKSITDNFDHCMIIEEGSLKPETERALEAENFRLVKLAFRPTAENFAKYIHDRIKDLGYGQVTASVYETPNNVATYTEQY
jgi:6-pyruvoyltetrahydropterin/6-carboxytetrahydropterin synthase